MIKKRPLDHSVEDDCGMYNGTQSEISTGEAEEAVGLFSLGKEHGRSFSPDFRPIRFGSLNISGLAGQAHLPENLIKRLDLDFLFLSETWTGPGGCKRLCPGTIHAQEQEVRSNGRFHYGQCLIINHDKISLDKVEVVLEDSGEDKAFVVVKIEGILFICCYFKPNQGVEWICDKLSLLEDVLSGDQPVVLLGDLNARHVTMDDHVSNVYGNAVVTFADNLNLKRVRPVTGRWTFVRGLSRSVIDHIVANDGALARGLESMVHEELFVGSTEHRLMTGRMVGMTPVGEGRSAASATRRPWNRWRLKNEEVVGAYCESLQMGLGECTRRLENLAAAEDVDVTAMDSILTKWISEGLRQCVGRSSGKGRKPADFLTPDLIRKEAILESFHSEMQRTVFGSAEYVSAWQRYDRSRKALKDEIQSRRNGLFKKFAVDLQEMSACEQMRVVNSIKSARGRTKGTLLKTDRRSLGEYGQFYAGQYQNKNPPAEGPLYRMECPESSMGDPFDEGIIRLTLERMPKGKATGDLGIPCEALSVAAEIVAAPLLILFRCVWKSGRIPDSWKVARIQPVPKKGDLTLIKNYRPISLTEVIRRAFETILVPKLSGLTSLVLEQGGFRTRRGTLDQLAVLQEWTIQSKAKGKARYMAFLDIKAAYDQVDRDLLWIKCSRQGIPAEFIKVLMALFDSNKAYLAINGANTATFPLKSGLLQGSPLSPILYSIFINDLVQAINENERKWRRESTQLGGRLFSCLLYADDIVLMANSLEHLEEMLETCQRHSIDNRYRFGVAKCETVCSKPATGLAIYGEPLKVSQSFPYLGIPVEASGINWNLHIRQMGAKMLRMAWLLNSVGCNGGGFDTATCLRIFCCFLRPMIEYGLALCPLKYHRLVQHFFAKAIRVVTSSGQHTSAICTGMFGEAQPAEIRILTLQYKFLVRSASKGTDFALSWARRASFDKCLKDSAFFSRTVNSFWQERERQLNRSLHTGEKFEPPSVYDLQDEALQAPLSKLSSCFVFRQKPRGQRRKLLYFWKNLNRTDQRLVLNWVLNRSAGPWKVCSNCKIAPGTKLHLEDCILGLSRTIEEREGAPSMIEYFYHNCRDPITLLGIVNMIKRLVGEYPARPP